MKNKAELVKVELLCECIREYGVYPVARHFYELLDQEDYTPLTRVKILLYKLKEVDVALYNEIYDEKGKLFYKGIGDYLDTYRLKYLTNDSSSVDSSMDEWLIGARVYIDYVFNNNSIDNNSKEFYKVVNSYNGMRYWIPTNLKDSFVSDCSLFANSPIIMTDKYGKYCVDYSATDIPVYWHGKDYTVKAMKDIPTVFYVAELNYFIPESMYNTFLEEYIKVKDSDGAIGSEYDKYKSNDQRHIPDYLEGQLFHVKGVDIEEDIKSILEKDVVSCEDKVEQSVNVDLEIDGLYSIKVKSFFGLLSYKRVEYCLVSVIDDMLFFVKESDPKAPCVVYRMNEFQTKVDVKHIIKM